MCGSAMWLRVMPTRSSRPSRIAWRAVETSSIFDACITARFVRERTSPQNSNVGAERMPWIGITSVRATSLSM